MQCFPQNVCKSLIVGVVINELCSAPTWNLRKVRITQHKLEIPSLYINLGLCKPVPSEVQLELSVKTELVKHTC